MCGANCGISDIEALMEFNHLCDEWGLDTISTGGVTGLAMDLSERKVHDFGLRFGDRRSYLSVPEMLARREGIGADLALGARGLASKYGCPELAMEVKNMELPGYDPRGAFGMSIAYATSDRGGCHQRSWPVAEEVMEGSMPAFSLDRKAEINIREQNWRAIKYSGIICDFWAINPEEMCGLIEMVWKREFGVEELLGIGERIWNLGRLFNVREGVERDTVPARLFEESGAHDAGASAGRAMGRDAFWGALGEFYALRGWDERGVPNEVKLVELGVDVRL